MVDRELRQFGHGLPAKCLEERGASPARQGAEAAGWRHGVVTEIQDVAAPWAPIWTLDAMLQRHWSSL